VTGIGRGAIDRFATVIAHLIEFRQPRRAGSEARFFASGPPLSSSIASFSAPSFAASDEIGAPPGAFLRSVRRRRASLPA